MKLKTLGVLISAITLTAAVGITANAKNVADYQDVKKGDWFYYYVENVSENGLMTGVGDTTFSPSADLERGQFATVIYRMHGAPETAFEYQFPDVKDGYFYSAPVTWAHNFGIIGGYDEGTFGPSDNITREQLATMLYRYAEKTGYDMSQTGDIYEYADAGNVSTFAIEGMNWAVGAGVIKGDQGLLNPHVYVSRAVCATMIARLKGIDEAEVEKKKAIDEKERQDAINEGYNFLVGHSFHMGQFQIAFLSKDTLAIYPGGEMEDRYYNYSITASYEFNKDEMSWLKFLNVNGVQYYLRCFTNGNIDLAGPGELEGFYEMVR